MSNRSSSHCIVIMYHGNDIPEFAEKAIMEQLVQVLVDRGICIPELVTVTYKDSSGLAASLARDILAAKEQHVEAVTEDPVKNALIYLGKRYEAELAESNLTRLTIKVADDIRAHKNAVAEGKDGDILLMNSLEILTTHQITAAHLVQTAITDRALNVFEQCYKYI